MENDNKSASNISGDEKSDNEWNDFERSLEVLLKNRRTGDSTSESSTSEHPPLGSPATRLDTTPLGRAVGSVAPAPDAPATSAQFTSPALVQPHPAALQWNRRSQIRPVSAGLPATNTSGSLRPLYTSVTQQGSRFRDPMPLLPHQPRPPTVHIPPPIAIPPPTSLVPVRVRIPPPSYPHAYIPLQSVQSYPEQFVYPYYPPITTSSFTGPFIENSYSTYSFSGAQQRQTTFTGPSPDNSNPAGPRYCELCPSPSPFNEREVDVHNSSHEAAMFQCAGCGCRLASYSLMASHVQVEHVGNDSELIKASIVIPTHPDMLKVYQCGIKTCSRKFVALTEGDLKKHIGDTHGEFYIHMGKGRNILRFCRICSDSEERRFATDEDFSSHIVMEHPLSLYANGECRSILPGSQKIPVLLNRHPQPLSRHASPLRFNLKESASTETPVLKKKLEHALYAADNVPHLNKARSIEENRKITMLRTTPVRDPDGSIINDRKRKRILKRSHHPKEEAGSTTDDNNRHEKSNKRRRYMSETLHKSKKDSKRKKLKEMSFSLSLSPEDAERKTKEKSKRKNEMQYNRCQEIKTEEETKESSSKVSQIKSLIIKKSDEVYCKACNCFTSDWSEHQDSFRHAKNDKKSRCFFCPDRFWFPQLKSHVSTHHENNSFICKAAVNCNIRLMELKKMVDHINTRHQRRLEPLYDMMGSNYISPILLRKHGILFFPEDLRRFTCRICSCHFLAQDKQAITDHLTLVHQQLIKHHLQLEQQIIYECRACEATLFGSESHLYHHIRKEHRQEPLDVAKRHNKQEVFQKSKSSSFKSDMKYERTSYHQARDCSHSRKHTMAPNVVQRFKTNFDSAGHSSNPNELNMGDNSEIPENTSDSITDYLKFESNVASSRSKVLNFDTMESCPFCGKELLSCRQKQHQQAFHSDLLFSCDSFCTQKFKSAWKNDVLSHLKDDHNKNKSDEMLMRHYLRLPSNLKMVCCKISTCDMAVFLGKSPNEMEEKLNAHVNQCHIGKTLVDCFNLACRSCNFVLPLDQETAWLDHLALNHKKNYFYTNQNTSLVASPTPPKDAIADIEANKVEITSDVESNMKLEENNEVIMSDGDKSNVLFEEGQCSFCTKTLLKTEEPRHVLEHHINELFHCQTCEDIGQLWTSFSVEELTAHFSTCHDDFECKVAAPPDGDVVMSVCSVCTAQFYTQDPAVLATHLANHEIGINLKMFDTFCRICGMHPEDNIEDHFKTAHEEEYRILALKNKKAKNFDSDVKPMDHSKIEVGDALKKDEIVITRTGLNKVIRNGKVIQVKHNPKVKWKITDLKKNKIKWQNSTIKLSIDKNSGAKISKQKKLKETFRAQRKKPYIENTDAFDQNEGKLLDQEIKQNCLYCPKDVKLTSLPFHVMTQHKKLTFRCTICVDSKIKKMPNKVCFDTLDAAGEHMDQVHNIDLKKMKNESMKRKDAEMKISCPVQSLLEVFCPGLAIPVDLRRRECKNCREKLVSLSSVERHNQICPKTDEALVRNAEETERTQRKEDKDNYENYKLSCRLCEAYFENEEQFLSHLK